MGRAIFISYRRDDTEGEAGRLFDDLVRAFGDNSVFMDVTGINPGIDFRKAIDDNVATCGVLLAMIGPTWATITNSSGERRLDDPNDFVRLEIGSALGRDIAVIPVLVHDAKMPRPDQLPENLKNLAYRNSVEITHARWNSDVQLLTQALSQYVTATSSTDREPVHATVAVQLPPPHSHEPHPPPAKSSKMPLLVGIGVVVVLAIVGIIFFAMHHSGGNAAATPPIQPAPAARLSRSGQLAAGKMAEFGERRIQRAGLSRHHGVGQSAIDRGMGKLPAEGLRLGWADSELRRAEGHCDLELHAGGRKAARKKTAWQP